jgi:hypothetical protein
MPKKKNVVGIGAGVGAIKKNKAAKKKAMEGLFPKKKKGK